MLKHTSKWISDATLLINQAEPGPWVSSSYGSQYNVEGNEHVIATTGFGDRDDCSGLNADFIAESRTLLPQAVSALKKVLDLHRRHVIFYDESYCQNTDNRHIDLCHVESSDEYGEYICLNLPYQTYCLECTNVEDSDPVEYPCETALAIESALSSFDG